MVRLFATSGQIGFNLILYHEEAAICMAQKYKAHYRKKVLVDGIAGVCTHGICGIPQPFFNGLNVFKL